MEFEKMEKATNLLNEANKCLHEYNDIAQVVNMYMQGAPAESCMERIRYIILGD